MTLSGEAGGAADPDPVVARQGAGLIELHERGLLAATGPHRHKLLHAVLSNDVLGLLPGRGCLASLMDVRGRLSALMRVLATADAVLMELPAARLAAVEATLLHYRVAAPVRFQRREVAVFALIGSAARAALVQAGVELPAEMAAEQHVEARVGGHELRVARAGDLPAGGFMLHAPAEAAPAVRAALALAGARPIGRPALDALRIEEGCAWYGPDVGEENLLHETGLVSLYHSSTKGCYVGQEIVARLEARGAHVSKALRGLRLSAPVEAGALVRAAGDDIGRVTTAAVSPRFGPIAMAYVHRKHYEPGTRVEVGQATAEVAALPLAGEPRS